MVQLPGRSIISGSGNESGERIEQESIQSIQKQQQQQLPPQSINQLPSTSSTGSPTLYTNTNGLMNKDQPQQQQQQPLRSTGGGGASSSNGMNYRPLTFLVSSRLLYGFSYYVKLANQLQLYYI